MSHNDYKEGWGIVDHDGLNVRSVSDTRRAAIVNWLVIEAKQMIYNNHTDEHINALWEAHRGEAMVRPIRMYVH